MWTPIDKFCINSIIMKGDKHGLLFSERYDGLSCLPELHHWKQYRTK